MHGSRGVAKNLALADVQSRHGRRRPRHPQLALRLRPYAIACRLRVFAERRADRAQPGEGKDTIGYTMARI